MNADGDATFDVWYRKEARAMTAAVAACTGDAHLAEEVVAEAFAKAFARWGKVRSMQSPLGWVFRTAMNRTRGAARRAKIEAKYRHRIGQPAWCPDPAASLPDQELWQAVADLSERARSAVVLRYVLDLDENEIASILGVSRGTVATTLHRARGTLRERLAPRGEAAIEGESMIGVRR